MTIIPEAPPVNETRIKMSYDEFITSVDEDAHAEWVDGEVIFFMPPKDIHQAISGFLFRLMAQFVELLQLGVMRHAPFEMRAKPDGNAREPDILFVASEHRARLTEHRLEGPADLVVEIISTESVGRDRGDKFYEYEEAGVREYWIVDPRPGKQRLDMWHLSAEGQYQPIVPDANGRYQSQVLPGFWLRAEWLTQEPLPDVIATLAEMRGLAPEVVQAFRAAFAEGHA